MVWEFSSFFLNLHKHSRSEAVNILLGRKSEASLEPIASSLTDRFAYASHKHRLDAVRIIFCGHPCLFSSIVDECNCCNNIGQVIRFPASRLTYCDIGGKMQNAVIFDPIWRKFYPHYTELPVPLELFRAGSREFSMMREPSLVSCSPFSV